MGPPVVSVEGVSRIYLAGDARALDNVSLAIEPGAFLAVTGPSGGVLPVVPTGQPGRVCEAPTAWPFSARLAASRIA
jgi:ABC-type phosphonate transport system ATPase subunit